jgi:hypothetical protein
MNNPDDLSNQLIATAISIAIGWAIAGLVEHPRFCAWPYERDAISHVDAGSSYDDHSSNQISSGTT